MSLIVLPPYNSLTAAVLGTLSYKALKVDGESVGTSNNSAIKDSSSSGMVPSAIQGRPAQGAFTPFSPTGWQAKFNGSDAIKLPSGTQVYNTMSSWYVDCFVTFDVINPGENNIWGFCEEPWGGATNYCRLVYNGNSKILQFDEANHQLGLWWIYAPFTAEAGRVYHIAAGRTGNTMFIYVDGVLIGSTTYATANFTDGTFVMGAVYYRGGMQGFMNGKIANLRIHTGETLTGPFAKPTSRLPVTAGTRFSFGNTGGYIDEGPYRYLIQGTCSFVPYSPFNQSGEYVEAQHGGSLYFDGVNDKLNYSGSAIFDLSAGFAFEAWLYPLAAPSGAMCRLAMFGDNGLSTSIVPLYINTDMTVGVGLPVSGKTQLTTPVANPLRLNAWTHVAVSVLSNGSARIFINGALAITGVINMPTNNGAGNIAQIGWEPTGTVNFKYKGYVSNLRLSNFNRYGAGFACPTAPLGVDANVKLLLDGTNGALTDRTGRTVLRETGLSTSNVQVKEGSKSVLANGANYMQAQLWPFSPIGTGDFTFSMWVYPNSQWGVAETFVSGQAANEIKIYRTARGQLAFGLIGGADLAVGGLIERAVWQHIEVSRASGVLRLFINGKIVATQEANATNVVFSTNWYSLFVEGLGTAGTYYKGYADLIETYAGQATHVAEFAPGYVSPDRWATFDELETGIYISTLTNGNLRAESGGNGHARSNLQMLKGKYYVEFKVESWTGRYAPFFGICNGITPVDDTWRYVFWIGGPSYADVTAKNGVNSAALDGQMTAVGDVIGMLFDADAGTLSIWINGNRSFPNAITGIPTGQPYAWLASSAGGQYPCVTTVNFGQNAFAYPERLTAGVTGLKI